MELIADLRHFSGADAMQWAADRSLDGRLIFRRNKRTVALAFAGGKILECNSNYRPEWFGQHLFAQGLVDNMDLAAAKRHSGGQRIGAALVALEIMTTGEVRRALSVHTLDLSCSVVGWPDGIVMAECKPLRELTELEPLPLDPLFSTLEAARREDELERMQIIVPHDNVELGVGDDPQDETLTPAQQRTLEVHSNGLWFGELYQLLGGCKFTLVKNIHYLIGQGLLTSIAIGTAPIPSPNTLTLSEALIESDQDVRLLASAR